MSKQLPRRMSAADAWFLYFEKPNAPLHIGSLGIFEGAIPIEKTIEGLSQRLHLIPRYRQRAVFPPLFVGHPVWQDDPQFALDRHVRAVELAAPGTDAQLHALTNKLFPEPLPRDRPLWDITVINGLQGGRTAYISRVHHCLVDGVSGMELLVALLDVTPDPPVIAPPAKEWEPETWTGPVLAWTEAVLDVWTQGALALVDMQANLLNAGANFRRLSDFASALLTAIPSSLRLPSPTIWNRPVGKERQAVFNTISFQEVRGIRGALGGTVNDVCLTILAGALGRYLSEHGVNTKGMKLRLMTPVNVRSEGQQGDMGNRVSMMLPQLPVGIDDPVKRLAAVREEIDRTKSVNQGGAFDQIAQLGNQAPAAFHALAGIGGLPPGMINLVCTNVPGPLIPLYGSGRRMLGGWPLLPLTGDLGLGVAIMSYDKSLYMGTMCDPTIVPDVELIRDAIDDEFRRLREAAGVEATDLPEEIGVAYGRPPSHASAAVA